MKGRPISSVSSYRRYAQQCDSLKPVFRYVFVQQVKAYLEGDVVGLMGNANRSRQSSTLGYVFEQAEGVRAICRRIQPYIRDGFSSRQKLSCALSETRGYRHLGVG